mgnify:CR=1 FL=1
MISLERFCHFFNDLGYPLISRYGGDKIGQVSFIIRSGSNIADVNNEYLFKIECDKITEIIDYFKECDINRIWINMDYNKFNTRPFDRNIEILDRSVHLRMFGGIESVFTSVLSLLESRSFIINTPRFKIGDRIIHNSMNFLIIDYIYDVLDNNLNYVCRRFKTINTYVIFENGPIDYRVIKDSESNPDRGYLIDQIIN